MMLCTLKSMHFSSPGEMKDSISLKKAAVWDGDWSVSNEIPGWIINTSTRTLLLSPKRITDLNQLMDMPPSQRWTSCKKLERVIGKLRSMHLAIS